MNESALAAMRAEEGARVVERAGRYWVETFRGFYQPVHQLATHRFVEIVRPTRLCWGFRAPLTVADAPRANGAYPVHLLTDLASFTEGALEESRRRDLRRCRSQVEIIRRPGADLFLANGWQVYLSATGRIGRGADHARRHDFERDITRRTADPRRLIVAGLINGRLAGYMESYAVNGVLYGRDLFVATEAAKTGIATGLYVETMAIGARTAGVDRLCLGPVIQDRPGLAWFKKTLGVPVAHVPTRVEIPLPVRELMRLTRPAVYYQITGLQARAGADA